MNTRPKIHNVAVVETLIEQWHDDHHGMTLPEFLGWTVEEFGHWVETGHAPE